MKYSKGFFSSNKSNMLGWFKYEILLILTVDLWRLCGGLENATSSATAFEVYNSKELAVKYGELLCNFSNSSNKTTGTTSSSSDFPSRNGYNEGQVSLDKLNKSSKFSCIPSSRRTVIISDDESHFNINLIGNVTYGETSVCINSRVNKTTISITVCDERRREPQSNPNNATVVFRKCCGFKDKFRIDTITRYSCQSGHEESYWEPALFTSTDDNFGDHEHLEANKTRFVQGFPNCSHATALNNHKDIWFKILVNGRVFIGLKFWFRPVWLPVDEDNGGFCVDELRSNKADTINYLNGLGNGNPTERHDHNGKNSGRNGDQSFKDLNTEDYNTIYDSHDSLHKNQVLLFCRIQKFDDYLFHRKLFGSLCIGASLCILILIIIYLSVWDKQNLAGWTQFNIFVAVFFVFGMEGMRTLVDFNGLLVQSTDTCIIIAAIAQYFFFALNFTWAIMCFDLFWTFWKLEGNIKGVKEHIKLLALYLLVSWGLPFLIVGGVFGFTHISESVAKNKMEGVYAYAHRRCSSPIRELGFQTQGVMFLFNLVFFACTAFLIWKHRRGINANRRNSRNEKYTWQSVVLFAKLLIVMGVTSLSLPLDYFFGSDDPLSLVAVMLRMVHFIPAVAALFIFGFNEKNVRLIKQKYPKFSEYMGLSLCHTKARARTTDGNSKSGPPNNNSSA